MTCTRELEVLFPILNKGKDIYTFSVPNVTIAYTWESKLRTWIDECDFRFQTTSWVLWCSISDITAFEKNCFADTLEYSGVIHM